MNKKIFGIFAASTIIHASFMGWFTYGPNYLWVLIYSTIACLILLPISYWINFKVQEALSQRGYAHTTENERIIYTLMISELLFIFIFVTSSISIILINGTR